MDENVVHPFSQPTPSKPKSPSPEHITKAVHSTPSKTLDTFVTAPVNIKIPQFADNIDEFKFSNSPILDDNTLVNSTVPIYDITSQTCGNTDVTLSSSQPPTDEVIVTVPNSTNPRKRQRIHSESNPVIEAISTGTQTDPLPECFTSTSTSPIRFPIDNSSSPPIDIDMATDSVTLLPPSPSQIIITKPNDDQTLKMARDYFGGKPYAGQQKLVADKYPKPSELRKLAAEDPKKAANFIFNYKKEERIEYPEKPKLIKFFEDAWNKPDPPNGGQKIKEIKVDEHTVLRPGQNDKFKYLGVNILANGQVEQVSLHQFKEMLAKIDGTKLDGRTKFKLMEKYGLPKLLFIMENSDQTRAELRKINGCYRNFVRKVHSLRHDFTVSGLHLKPHNGGIGATDIEERVARGKYNATTKMINDQSSKSFRKVVEKSKIVKVRRDNAKYLAIGEDDTDLRSQHQHRLLSRLTKSARVNTTAKSFFENKRANRWINNDRIPSKLRNDFFKLRYNIMPTRSSTSETVKHLISKCTANKGLITLRHNEVINHLLRIGPRNKDARVYKEKTFMTGDGYIKPDLIMITNNMAKVFEIAVPYEEDEKALETLYNTKLKKYKKHEAILKENLQ
ncbi:hypothetical protein SNEBB_011144, partial [Seison nebaliae]